MTKAAHIDLQSTVLSANIVGNPNVISASKNIWRFILKITTKRFDGKIWNKGYHKILSILFHQDDSDLHSKWVILKKPITSRLIRCLFTV